MHALYLGLLSHTWVGQTDVDIFRLDFKVLITLLPGCGWSGSEWVEWVGQEDIIQSGAVCGAQKATRNKKMCMGRGPGGHLFGAPLVPKERFQVSPCCPCKAQNRGPGVHAFASLVAGKNNFSCPRAAHARLCRGPGFAALLAWSPGGSFAWQFSFSNSPGADCFSPVHLLACICA